jgi:hypothetical protein
MRWFFNTKGGLVFGLGLVALSWWWAVNGTHAARFPEDVSIRAESASGTRIHGHGGLHGGK